MALVDDGFGYSHSFEEKSWGEVKKGYCHFQNGDIGIAKISPCFENRKSTIFSALPNGIGAGTTELTILRGTLVDCRFFLYLFQSEWYLCEGTKNFKGVVGQQRVNKEIFTTLLIPLPPLAEQHRIVTEIERWFAVIDELEKNGDDLKTAVEQTKKKVLDLAIRGKLVPQNPNDEPASELLKRLGVSSDNRPYENVPMGWKTCSLEDITDYEQPQKYIVSSANYADIYKTPVLTAGKSFIIGYTNEHNGVFTNLPVIIFDDFTTESKYVNFPFKVKSSAIKILKVKECADPKFVAYFMSVTRLIGKTHKRYWISEYCKLRISLPPLAEQHRIVAKIEEIYSQLDAIESSLKV